MLRIYILSILIIFFSKAYCQEEDTDQEEVGPLTGLVDSTVTINDTIFLQKFAGNCHIKVFILDKNKAKNYRLHSPHYRDFLKELNIDSLMNEPFFPKKFIRQIEKSNIACKGIDFSSFPKASWRNLSIFKDEIYIDMQTEQHNGLLYQKGYFYGDIGWMMIGCNPIKILSIKKLNRFQHEVVTLSTEYDSVMHYETEIVALIDTVRNVYAWGNKIIRTPINNMDVFPQIITESACKPFPIYFKETDYIQQPIYEIEAILREERDRK